MNNKCREVKRNKFKGSSRQAATGSHLERIVNSFTHLKAYKAEKQFIQENDVRIKERLNSF